MSRLVINDLPENIELDREAMRAISGGKSAERMALQFYRTDYFKNPLDFSDTSRQPLISAPFNDWPT